MQKADKLTVWNANDTKTTLTDVEYTPYRNGVYARTKDGAEHNFPDAVKSVAEKTHP